MKIVYDVIEIGRFRGYQNKKVFIYEDGQMVSYLWMSNDDLSKNIEQCKKDGDDVELKESYKDKN